MNNNWIVEKLNARMILDSRGVPTIEADIKLKDGWFGRSSVPSGSSVGSREAIELRDHDLNWHGKGVTKALNNINKIIAQNIIGKNFISQKALDDLLIGLDGTQNKSRLGANALLAVSMAFAKACAASCNKQLYNFLGNSKLLPTPFFNIINGGKHADNGLDIQEFMIAPIGLQTFSKKLQAGSEIFHTLKQLLHNKNLSTNVGDEGGFAPDLNHSKDVLLLIMEAIEKAGYKLGEEISIALDVAASELYHDGKYILKGERINVDSEELIYYLEELCKIAPICSIEDPMHESDYIGWQAITKSLGSKHQIVGDDIFVTNAKLINYGIKHSIANCVLIKPNQIGTLTETLDAIDVAHKNGYKTMMSHRSGETEDVSIAHISVAYGCGQIKSGSLSRTDRLCKYNEILRIEESLNK